MPEAGDLIAKYLRGEPITKCDVCEGELGLCSRCKEEKEFRERKRLNLKSKKLFANGKMVETVKRETLLFSVEEPNAKESTKKI